MLTLVGVGHVFNLKQQLHDIIAARRPNIVGLELDPLRFQALQTRAARGDAPGVVRLLSFFQERIAAMYGGRVGDEMLAAADAARSVGAELALIDADSTTTFRRLWTGMPFEERVRLFVAALTSLFVSKTRVEKELARFHEDEAAYLEGFAAQFPQVKRVLIDERDAHMARALRTLLETRGRVVAVVGDGHVEGIRRQLPDIPAEVIRLRDIREGTLPGPPPTPPEGPSVTFTYRMAPPP